MIVLDLPVPPSVNNLFVNTKKGRQIGEAYRAWLFEAGWMIQATRRSRIEGPVCVSITVQDGGRADLDNLSKAPIDAMVRHGVIDGDGPKVVRKIVSEFSPDIQGCRVTVEKYGEGA